MAAVQVQVKVPKKVVQKIDRWIAEGRFADRSEAIKTVVALYEEREMTREFYWKLLNRSEQAKKKPDSLIPIREANELKKARRDFFGALKGVGKFSREDELDGHD